MKKAGLYAVLLLGAMIVFASCAVVVVPADYTYPEKKKTQTADVKVTPPPKQPVVPRKEPQPKPKASPDSVTVKAPKGLIIPPTAKYRSQGSCPVKYFVIGTLREKVAKKDRNVVYVAFKNYSRNPLKLIQVKLTLTQGIQQSPAPENIGPGQEKVERFLIDADKQLRNLAIMQVIFNREPYRWPQMVRVLSRHEMMNLHWEPTELEGVDYAFLKFENYPKELQLWTTGGMSRAFVFAMRNTTNQPVVQLRGKVMYTDSRGQEKEGVWGFTDTEIIIGPRQSVAVMLPRPLSGIQEMKKGTLSLQYARGFKMRKTGPKPHDDKDKPKNEPRGKDKPRHEPKGKPDVKDKKEKEDKEKKEKKDKEDKAKKEKADKEKKDREKAEKEKKEKEKADREKKDKEDKAMKEKADKEKADKEKKEREEKAKKEKADREKKEKEDKAMKEKADKEKAKEASKKPDKENGKKDSPKGEPSAPAVNLDPNAEFGNFMKSVGALPSKKREATPEQEKKWQQARMAVVPQAETFLKNFPKAAQRMFVFKFLMSALDGNQVDAKIVLYADLYAKEPKPVPDVLAEFVEMKLKALVRMGKLKDAGKALEQLKALMKTSRMAHTIVPRAELFLKESEAKNAGKQEKDKKSDAKSDKKADKNNDKGNKEKSAEDDDEDDEKESKGKGKKK